MTDTPQRRRNPAIGVPVARSATPMTLYTVSFDNAVAAAIRDIAIARGTSVSAVIREACLEGLGLTK